jgi:hypothetical protein
MAAASTPHVGAQAGSRAEPELSGWIVFAALMLLVAGGFSLVYGLAALLNDQVVTVGGKGVIVWDFTVWGWVHLVIGAVMLLTCWGLFALKGFARWTAIFIAIINAMIQMATITAFPLWSIMMITLDVIIIYQLTVNWAKEPAY